MTNTQTDHSCEDEPLTAESLEAAFRLAAEARDGFKRYREMYPDKPMMLGLAVLSGKEMSTAVNDINKRLILYRIQKKQELAVRTIHKWCEDPVIVADTETQTLRIAREHKAWSDLYKGGGNGAWQAPAVVTAVAGEKFMPPPDGCCFPTATFNRARGRFIETEHHIEGKEPPRNPWMLRMS